MNLTLGTLLKLKTWLLNPDLVAKTTYDASIAQLGRGIAAQFEGYCGRKFARAERTRMLAGHLCNFVLFAYPVEGVPVVEMNNGGGEYQPAQGHLEKFLPESGVVWLSSTDAVLRRVTWTGGYWFDETEDSSGACPDGATPLPEALHFAWLQQCAHTWAKRQKLGTPINSTVSTAEVQQALIPEVQATLNNYRRFNL